MAPRVLSILIGALFFAGSANAQIQSGHADMINAALDKGDMKAALVAADAHYTQTIDQNDMMGAGKAAYTRAKILEATSQYVKAGKAYSDCAEHYGAQQAMGQSLNCKYDAALAFLAGGKKGTALNELRANIKELKKIGQDQSELAARVYLLLAQETRPSKLEDRVNSQADRNRSIQYAELAMAAMKAAGTDQSEYYASALFAKAVALEDSKKYEDAKKAYTAAIARYILLPNHDKAVLKNATTRLSIVSAHASKTKSRNTMDVRDSDGEKVVLNIKKKKKIRVPRVDRKKIIDGARARVQISLNADGGVSDIKILESTPEADYGEAMVKSIRKWKFSAPENVALETLPPFEYGMTFSVYRR